MKNLVLYLLICLIFESLYSQETYYPLIESGKTWYVLDGGFGGFATNIYKVEGDTIINQHSFKILYHSNEEFPVTWTKHGYIREDEKKVYYSPYSEYDTVFQEPGMVYDFDVELNDTLTITSFAYNYPTEIEIVITSIDSILIEEEYRKKVSFACESIDENFWIEGIGSNNGLIEPGFYCYIVCPTIELLCVKESENVIYHNEYYESCFIVGIHERLNKSLLFQVFPNPAKTKINIVAQTNNYSDILFKLCNLHGEILLIKRLTNYNYNMVNTEKLKAGLYFYTITNKSDLIQNGKIIIE